MTAIVMEGVNAVYTLECVHRRHLLGVRALNDRLLLFRGRPSMGDVYIDDLVILSVLQFSDVQRADALYDYLQNADE